MNTITETVVDLAATPHFPRHLKISWRPERVVVIIDTEVSARMLAFASVEHGQGERLYLEHTIAGSALWIGCAAFDVSAPDFERIRTALQPLGLTVKIDLPSPAANSLAAAPEAAPPHKPPGGERGTTPATASQRRHVGER